MAFFLKSDTLYDVGYKSAPFFVEYSRNLHRFMTSKKVEKIFFLTREGVILKRIYELCCRLDHSINKNIESELLYVSRLSTLFPSVGKVDLCNFKSLLTVYGDISIYAFFESLGVDSKDYDDLIKKYSLESNEAISNFTEDSRVKKLFSDSSFINKMTENKLSFLIELEDYLVSSGITKCKSIGVVDIGWRGSIQDNLSKILPSSIFHGFYFALEKYKVPQGPNNSKKSWGVDANYSDHHNDIFRSVSVLEILFNSDFPSVQNYRNSNPVFSSEGAGCDNGTIAFQKGLLDGLNEYCYSSDSSNCYGFDSWSYALIKTPPDSLVELFFDTKHDETYGLGRIVSKSYVITAHDILISFFSKKKRKIFVDNVVGVNWFHGYIRRSDISFFRKVLGGTVLLSANLVRTLRKYYG